MLYLEECGQTCVSLNSTSNLIISGGTDCAVNTWNVKTNKLQKSYKVSKIPEEICVFKTAIWKFIFFCLLSIHGRM